MSLPAVIQELITYGAMARQKRMDLDTSLEKHGEYSEALALPVVNSLFGESTDGETTVLMLQIDAGDGRRMNFPLSLDLYALRQLSETVSSAIAAQEMNNPPPRRPSH